MTQVSPKILACPSHYLKAANGTRMSCFGYKQIDIKIGRKNYPFRIIKSQVESPILGWDFMKIHKLDLRWNDDDQITIYDKKAKISSVLEFKPIPVEHSALMKNLSLITDSDPPEMLVHDNPEIILGEVAAMDALDGDDTIVHDENIDILPNSPYKELLSRYPGLLKQNFHTEPTKSNIIHRIHTDGPPIKAKVRRLLPGSDKAIKAKKAS